MLRSFLYSAKPGAVSKMQPIRSLLIDTDVFVPVHNAFPKAHIVLPVRFFFGGIRKESVCLFAPQGFIFSSPLSS